jgi:hypothetical protein
MITTVYLETVRPDKNIFTHNKQYLKHNGIQLGAYFILSQLLCFDFIYWTDDGCDKPKHVATSLGIVIYDNCCVYD